MMLSLGLHVIALCAQFFAALIAITLFLKSPAYRLVCGFLALALVLMVEMRILAIFNTLQNHPPYMVDSWLSAPISVSILLGVIYFKKLLIELEEKNFKLDQASRIDSLTSSLSRVETISRADLEVKKSFRSLKNIAFLMVDIDHFKLVNDTFGHPIGDQVLIKLANEFKEELREIDVFGRVGGEEFLIVLPDTSQTKAVEIADRLRLRISHKAIASASNKQIFITVSIGISIFDPQQSASLDSNAIVQKHYVQSDAAMYRAKQAGRNQVRF